MDARVRPDSNEMPLGIGRNRDHHIAVNKSYPRTSQITSTPSKALTIPAIRNSPSGVSSAEAASRLARPGSAAKISPSIASTRHRCFQCIAQQRLEQKKEHPAAKYVERQTDDAMCFDAPKEHLDQAKRVVRKGPRDKIKSRVDIVIYT